MSKRFSARAANRRGSGSDTVWTPLLGEHHNHNIDICVDFFLGEYHHHNIDISDDIVLMIFFSASTIIVKITTHRITIMNRILWFLSCVWFLCARHVHGWYLINFIRSSLRNNAHQRSWQDHLAPTFSLSSPIRAQRAFGDQAPEDRLTDTQFRTITNQSQRSLSFNKAFLCPVRAVSQFLWCFFTKRR